MEHYVKNMLKYIDYPNGFFIEAGANDGIAQSYTYELEKNGWRGILIEPSLDVFENCMLNRSSENSFYNCALVAYEGLTGIKGDFDGHLMASIDGKRLEREWQVIVPARTLNSILEELRIHKIDLFSLDVEGYELEVLKGFNIMKYRPKFIIIEIYDYLAEDIQKLMDDSGYELIECLTGYNKKDYPNWDGTHNDYLFKAL